MSKWIFSLAVMSLVASSGCARNYVITLNNGSQIGTTSKPRLKGGVYVFKDGMGRDSTVSAGAIREIAPASMVNEEKSPFIPQRAK
jgi:hypothetical protein